MLGLCLPTPGPEEQSLGCSWHASMVKQLLQCTCTAASSASVLTGPGVRYILVALVELPTQFGDLSKAVKHYVRVRLIAYIRFHNELSISQWLRLHGKGWLAFGIVLGTASLLSSRLACRMVIPSSMSASGMRWTLFIT